MMRVRDDAVAGHVAAQRLREAPVLQSTVVMHRGLLLGLATRKRSFNSDGVRFHAAYGCAMRAYECPATQEALESFDPVFGVYTEASAMILEGMRDLLLTLDSPRLVRARFKVSVAQAERELAEFAWSSQFGQMGLAMALALE